MPIAQKPILTKQLISIIVPCFNEQENVVDCYQVIKDLWENSDLSKTCDFEIIFVDDGSKDLTIIEIEKVAKRDKRVRLIEFSRNFGKELATSAGLNNCLGDAAVIIDADLQYPVDKVPEFIHKWQQGSKVVIGIRDKKKTNNLIEKLGSNLFYYIMDRIGETQIIPGALDFRLMDREVIDQFSRFTERGRMTRALVDWLGFERDYIHYEELPRNKGQASYSFSKRVKLALSSFILHSLFPLKLAGYLGISITVISGLLGLFALFNQFIFKQDSWITFSGTFLLGLLNLFLIGVVLICLGLVALYIANIHTEVTNRPLYIIKRESLKQH